MLFPDVNANCADDGRLGGGRALGLFFGGALPWEANNLSFTTMAASESWQITPSLDDIQAIMREVGPRKTVLAIYFRNHYVLDDESGLKGAGALVATFGVSDRALLEVLSGKAKPVGGHTTKGQSPLIPTKAMSLLERNLQPDGQIVRVCLRTNEVLFRTETAVIYSRLVDGRFPDYRQVFPKKPAIKIPLAVPSFHAAVRQAAILTDEDSKRVTFRFETDKLTLQTKGASAGRSKVELKITYEAGPVLAPEGTWAPLGKSLATVVEGQVAFLSGLVMLAAWIGPWLLLAGGGIWLFRRSRAKRPAA